LSIIIQNNNTHFRVCLHIFVPVIKKRGVEKIIQRFFQEYLEMGNLYPLLSEKDSLFPAD